MRDWVSRISLQHTMIWELMKEWVPPPIGTLKLNFDGSSKGNPDPVGFGCIVCDELNQIMLVVSGPLGRCDSKLRS